jgi:hypothetical protein
MNYKIFQYNIEPPLAHPIRACGIETRFPAPKFSAAGQFFGV